MSEVDLRQAVRPARGRRLLVARAAPEVAPRLVEQGRRARAPAGRSGAGRRRERPSRATKAGSRRPPSSACTGAWGRAASGTRARPSGKRLPEQREEVVRMVAEDRQGALFGFWPVRIAGTATVVEAETVVVFRVPGRAGGEPGEVREALRVDSAVGLLQVDHRELVEEQEHDRLGRASADRPQPRRCARDDELRGRRVEQESRETGPVRRPAPSGTTRRRTPPPHRERDGQTDQDRAGDQQRRPVDAGALSAWTPNTAARKPRKT